MALPSPNPRSLFLPSKSGRGLLLRQPGCAVGFAGLHRVQRGQRRLTNGSHGAGNRLLGADRFHGLRMQRAPLTGIAYLLRRRSNPSIQPLDALRIGEIQVAVHHRLHHGIGVSGLFRGVNRRRSDRQASSSEGCEGEAADIEAVADGGIPGVHGHLLSCLSDFCLSLDPKTGFKRSAVTMEREVTACMKAGQRSAKGMPKIWANHVKTRFALPPESLESYDEAAITAISMENSGAASFALTTVARAGVAPGTTHASHTLFISANVAMSVNQMVAVSSLLLSVLAPASRPSMVDRMSWVCSATLFPGAPEAT